MTFDELKNLMVEVRDNACVGFSGMGVIVTNSHKELPVLSLRDVKPTLTGKTSFILAKISNHENTFHDGFHILDSDGNIILVAQYFSPPIVHDVYIDRARGIGGRFVAALLGSKIPGVIMTGIISENSRLSIFKNGLEIYVEENQ